MRTERPEALSLLRKWAEESTLLFCEVNLPVMAVGFEGKIVSLTDKLVVLRSGEAPVPELRLALEPVVSFGSGDTRAIPEEREMFDFGLVMFFEDPNDAADPPRVAFIERRL